MTYAVNESSNTKHLLSHPQQKTRSWKKWETEHKWKSSRLGKEHSEFKRWCSFWVRKREISTSLFGWTATFIKVCGNVLKKFNFRSFPRFNSKRRIPEGTPVWESPPPPTTMALPSEIWHASPNGGKSKWIRSEYCCSFVSKVNQHLSGEWKKPRKSKKNYLASSRTILLCFLPF